MVQQHAQKLIQAFVVMPLRRRALCNKTQKSCLCEFFLAKSFVVTQKNFPPSWFG